MNVGTIRIWSLLTLGTMGGLWTWQIQNSTSWLSLSKNTDPYSRMHQIPSTKQWLVNQNETASGISNPNISVTSLKLVVLFLSLTTMSQYRQYFSKSSPHIHEHVSDSSPQWKYRSSLTQLVLDVQTKLLPWKSQISVHESKQIDYNFWITRASD